VDVWSGAVPAQTADRLSGAVNINARDGARDRMHASGNIGLISTHATVDGPLGARGSYLLSGRRTYLDAFTSVASKAGLLEMGLPYAFSDLFLHAAHDVGKLGRITLSSYVDHEGVSMNQAHDKPFSDIASFHWGSAMGAVSLQQPVTGSLLLNARAGYSQFRGTFDLTTFRARGAVTCRDGVCDESGLAHDTVHSMDADTRMRDAIGELSLTWYRRGHQLTGGVRYDDLSTAHALRSPEVATELARPFAIDASIVTIAGFLEDRWRYRSTDVRLGVRALSTGSLGSVVMPRFGIHTRISPTLALSFGGGRYAQTLRSMRDDESAYALLIAYDLQTVQPASVGMSTSTDLVAGAEWMPNPQTSLRADAYVKRLSGLVLGYPTPDPQDAPLLVVDSFRTGRGNAHGLELIGHRTAGRFDINASYALSSTTRTVGSEEYAPRFDRRHVFDATVETHAGQRGTVSARFTVGSGQPFTPAIGLSTANYYDPSTNKWEGTHTVPVLGGNNAGRLPGYKRVDVAFRKTYSRRWFGEDMTLTPYVQVLNVLNSKNVLLPDVQLFNGRPQFKYWPQMPVLPTFGLEWKF
jgi:hypothetical protein